MTGRRELVKRVAQCLGVGTPFGFVFGLAYGPAFGVAFGLGCGIAFGVLIGLRRRRPSTVSNPSDLLKQGLAHDLGAVLACAFTFGLCNGFANGLISGLVGGLACGACFGADAGLVYVARTPWARYLIAVAMLSHQRAMPFRTARFLDWAYNAGLLRQSGTSIQFRHDKLQTLLTPVRPLPTDTGAIAAA